MRTMHVRFDVAFVAVVTVALLAATPAEAGKGSAMCGAYERVDVSLLADPNSGDFSRCKYGHRATDEEQGKNCISRPAFSCNFCTRHAKYSKVKNHTCACIDETKRDELRQNTDATRIAWGWFLLVVGVILSALSIRIVFFDGEAYDKNTITCDGERNCGTYVWDFMYFWFVPLGCLAGGIALLAYFYGLDPQRYFRGCCDGYEKCA